tara:strand:+ start:668 stop:850 length:183 start_codon:yes stop_codon:yes gene_type:complete
MGCPRKLKGKDMTKKEMAEDLTSKLEAMMLMIVAGRNKKAEEFLADIRTILRDAIEEDDE